MSKPSPYPLESLDWQEIWEAMNDGIIGLLRLSETQYELRRPERVYGAMLDLAEVAKVLCVIEWAGLMADPPNPNE